MTLARKIEAALVAYLGGLTLPSGFTAAQLQPGEDDEVKDGQVVVCAASDASEEIPPKTANMMVTVGIEVHTPYTSDTKDEDGNTVEESSLAQHRLVAEFIEASILDDNLPALLTAAQADFTCMGVPQRTTIHGQADGCYVSGMTLQMYCRGNSE